MPKSRAGKRLCVAMVMIGALGLGACGTNGGGGLSENSTCGDYNNADQPTRDRFVQDEINAHHSSRGVADIEGYLDYNCGQNIDRNLSTLLTPAHF